MRSITPTLTPEIELHVGDLSISQASGFPVNSFRQLVEHVAQLSYLNKDHLLFFRGQGHDHKNKANSSTIYPSIYRGERVSREQLDLSFSILEASATRLCDVLEKAEVTGFRDVRRRRYIQWSILQHYGVCTTPLLDLTHSLRVACTFSYLASDGSTPYVFVFGLPYTTNRISINSEHDLVNVRLLSICPPQALRPHFQEGYLAATDEVLMDFDSKSELDFNNRIVAKFSLPQDGRQFWQQGFRAFPKEVLFPKNDRFFDLCSELRSEVGTGVAPGRIGQFLEEWTRLESLFMDLARSLAPQKKVFSVLKALETLRVFEDVTPELTEQLHELRRIRNEVVHRPDRVSARKVAAATSQMRSLIPKLSSRRSAII
jgi:hypothetical protein